MLFEGRTGGAVWAMPGLAVIGGCVGKWSDGGMARGGRVLECEFVGDRVPEGASGGNAIVATKHCRRECVKFVDGLVSRRARVHEPSVVAHILSLNHPVLSQIIWLGIRAVPNSIPFGGKRSVEPWWSGGPREFNTSKCARNRNLGARATLPVDQFHGSSERLLSARVAGKILVTEQGVNMNVLKNGRLRFAYLGCLRLERTV